MSAHTANEIFARTVRSERKITAQILRMILNFEDNKYHIELGYSSLFEWLTKAHGYDEGSANRRIQAARAMRAVPEVERKLQDGQTTMTNLVKVQSIFRHAGQMSTEQKREVIKSIEGQTTAEATQTLFKMFPEAASKINQDRRMIVDEEHVRYAYNLNKEQEEMVTRAKELLSHKIPNGSMAEVVTYLAAYFVQRNDPLLEKPSARRRTRQSGAANAGAAWTKSEVKTEVKTEVKSEVTSEVKAEVESNSGKAAEKSIWSSAETEKSKSSRSAQLNFAHPNFVRSTSMQSSSAQSSSAQSNSMQSSSVQSAAVASKRRVTVRERKEVIRDAGGQCEYVDHVTGKRCDNRVRVEADHIRMRVFGGSNMRQNLRCLCRVHNQFMSEKNLGKTWANHWRTRVTKINQGPK
jgi:hypothetical protein